MTAPKVTVVSTAFRPGGIDVLLAGLRDQSFQDFNVVISDRRYELRHDRVMDLARSYGLADKILHVPEHRRNGKWTSFCAGWNSAFALATGELVVMLQEWAYARPDWLASHVRAHEKAVAAGSRSVYILSPYVYTAMPPLKLLQPFDFTGQRSRGDRCVEADAILTGGVLDELSAFEGGLFDPAWIKGLRLYGKPDQDTRAASPGSKVPDTWVHIKNESISRRLLWEMNGLDERMERGKGPMDLDFGIRLTNGRVPLIWNPGAICIVPDPRWIVRTMPWGDMTERLENRWSYNDGLVYNARRKKDGLTVAQNPYTMEGLAARLSGWRDETKHPVVPRDVDDATYWGRDIWPDSE